MNPTIPAVSDYMTPAPHAITAYEKLSSARAMMETYDIRHLPVLDGDKLIGILSDRDLNLVQTLAHAPPDSITVEDAMSSAPYWVPPEAPLQQVARVMAERKLGSAVVMDHGTIAGVFTTTDALNALADALEGKDVRRMYEAVPTDPPAGHRSRESDLR